MRPTKPLQENNKNNNYLHLRKNPEVAGLSPALVNFSLFIQIYLKSVPSQFSLWFIT